MQTITRCVLVGTALLVALLAAQPVQAALLYYESFSESSYPVEYDETTPDLGGIWEGGPTPPDAGGTFNPNDEIVSGSLDSTGTLALPPSGGKLHVLGRDRARGLSTMDSSTGADGTTTYASLLIDLGDPGAGAEAFTGVEIWNGVLAPNVATNRSVKIGFDGGVYAVRTNTGTGDVALDAGLNLVVLKFNYITGEDTVDVFVNPTWDDLVSNTFRGQLTDGNFAFDRFGLSNFNQVVGGPNPTEGTTGFADEIRVGTTLADVVLAPAISAVPEPSTLALLLVAGFVAMLSGWRGCVRTRDNG